MICVICEFSYKGGNICIGVVIFYVVDYVFLF